MKEALITKVYNEAVSYLNPSWFHHPETLEWFNCVMKLTEEQRTTYLIVLLVTQVFNGGFHQYYSNLYEQFAYETAKSLQLIKANEASRVVLKSLEVVNFHRYDPELFPLSILASANEILADIRQPEKLELLDDELYELNDEVLEKLSNYLTERVGRG